MGAIKNHHHKHTTKCLTILFVFSVTLIHAVLIIQFFNSRKLFNFMPTHQLIKKNTSHFHYVCDSIARALYNLLPFLFILFALHFFYFFLSFLAYFFFVTKVTREIITLIYVFKVTHSVMIISHQHSRIIIILTFLYT